MTPALGRIERRRALRALPRILFASALLVTITAGVATALWTARSVPGGNGTSGVASVNQGASPVAVGVRQTITINWAPSTLSNRTTAADGYYVKRYDFATNTPQTVLAGCSGRITATTCTEVGVPEGRWVYTITPAFATNWRGAESLKSSAVMSDGTAPTNNVSMTVVTGGAYQSGNTIYYGGGTAGSLTLTNDVSDEGTGPASSTTTAMTGATGWAHTASTVSTPAGGPYDSNVFTWAAGTTSTPVEAVTAGDVAGNTGVTSLTFRNDSTTPTAGTVTYTNGYVTGRSVAVALTTGSDSGSGIATRQLQRATAPLTNLVCGTFSGFTDVGPDAPTSPYIDSAVSNGVCYKYQYLVTDQVGNQRITTSASIAKVDYRGAVMATGGLLSYWRLGETAAAIATDSFTGANGALLRLHSADLGGSWTYISGGNDERIYEDRITSTGSGRALYRSAVVPSSPNYAVEADLYYKSMLTGDMSGVIGRQTGTTTPTFYMARYEVANNKWWLVKYSGTTPTDLNSSVAQALTVGQTYRLRLEMTGTTPTTLRLFVNGVLTVSASDSSTPLIVVGSAGFMEGENNSSTVKSTTYGIHLDNFEVTNLRAADSDGSNHAAYVDGVTIGAPGALTGDANTAAQFDGVDDYVQATGTSGIPIGNAVRSVEMWFKTSSSSQQVLFSYGTAAATKEFGLWLNDGGASITAWGWGGGNDKSFTLSDSVTDGLWHQVIETFDGSSLTLYVDGVALPTQGATRATAMDSTYGFGIGAVLAPGDGNSGHYFNGSLDEVSLYTTALTPTTVTDHFQLGHAPADLPPQVTATVTNLAYSENATTPLDALITVTDPVSPNLTGATVTMTTNYASDQDSLGFTNQNGITGTWTSATGVLALTGTATVSDYQSALRSITYTNDSEAPTTATRTVEFVASDGAPGNTASRQITVSAVNDKPVNVVPAAQSMIVNTVTVFSGGNGNAISITDVDAANGMVKVQLVNTNGAVTLSTTSGLTFAIGDGTADATMTFTGTVASVNASLAGATFRSASGFIGAASIQIITDDQGNSGSGGAMNDNKTVEIRVASVPPVVTTTVANAAYTENGSPLVVDAAITVNDSDSVDLTGATVAMTTNYFSGQDTLSFAPQHGITGSWTAATGVLALSGVAGVADYEAALRTITYSNTSDAPATANRTITFNVADDSTSNTTGRQITVTAVNDPPVGTSNTRTTSEDAPYTMAGADFGYSDPTDSGANTLSAVKITTLPAVGSLKLNGVAVTVGQLVTAANISSNLLVFSPVANANGATYSSFTFQVQDNGGTANGGIDLDTTPNTLTFNVTAVNDPPTGASTTRTTNEDTPYPVATADFGFSDALDNPANALAQVKIITLPTAGALKLNNTSVTVGQIISVANISSNLLVFSPVANANGAAYSSFTFQVQDNGGTANSGIDLDTTPNTMTFNVTAVNDAPVAAVPTAQTTTRNSAKVFSSGTGNPISISDIDAASSPIQVQLTSSNATTTLSTVGGLSFSIGDGTADATMTFSGTITAINTALATVTVTPAAGFAGAASLQIIASDLGNTGSGGALTDDHAVAITVRSYVEAIAATSGLMNYWRLGETTLTAETFAGAAGATLQTLPSWTKHPISSADAVITTLGRIRKAGTTQANQGAVYYNAAVPSSADYSVYADVYYASSVANDVVGVAGRIDPANATFYGAMYDRASRTWMLYSVDNGAIAVLGSSSAQTLAVSTTYRLTLDMNGSTIRVLVDGVQRVSVTDTAVATAGRGGILVGFGTAGSTLTDATGLHLDNFMVTPGMADDLAVNQGTYVGGPTLGVAGVSAGDADTAVQFDGVNDYATAARQIGDDFSIEFWFNSTQGLGTGTSWTQGAGLVDADVSGTTNDFGVSLRSDGRVVAGVGGTANVSVVSTAGGLNNGTWHHVVFTRSKNSKALLLYIDGALAVPQGLGSTTASLTSPANINFGRIQSGTNYYAGALDEIAVYDEVLTSDTITAHFNAGT